jgi:PAS domain S-box-containing protein
LVSDAALYRALVEHCGVGLFKVRLDGTILYANHRLAEIVDAASAAALVDVEFPLLVNDAVTRERLLSSFCRGEALPAFELVLTTRAGRERIVRLTTERVSDSLACTLVDVSEQRRAEEDLRESEELSWRIIEAMPAGVIEVSEDGQIVRASAEAIRYFRVPADEITSLNVFRCVILREDGQICAPEDHPIARCLQTRRRQPPTTLGFSEQGQTFWAIYTAVPVTEFLDGPGGAIVTFLDITERKRTEQALAQNEERYRAMVERSPDPMAVQRAGRLLFVNAAGARLVGKAAEQLIGTMGFELVHPDSRETFVDKIGQVHRTGDIAPIFEAKLLRSDGSSVEVEVAAVPLTYYAEPAVQIVARDITRRKQAEEQLRRLEAQVRYAQKLESLGVLAGGIAHDFNNLLAIIMGNAALATMNMPAGALARRDVERIEAAAERAAELTKQMLAYAGKGKFAVEALSLTELVEQMADLLRTALPKTVRLRTTYAPDAPAILADAAQIQQVVMNLITNAADAIGDVPGTVDISIFGARLDGTAMDFTYVAEDLDAGQFVCLEVRDTGRGMEAETVARIFDPFYTTKMTGRGLGLAATLGIVRGHRGAINVTSAPDQGCTFRVYFPVTAELVKTPAPASANGGPRISGRTVLVIDDEAAVREMTRANLEAFGFDVLLAAYGNQGVDLFREHAQRIDAVLLDLTMPDMSGGEVLRAIQQLSPAVRVILSSGYSEEEAASLLTASGSCRFLQKPYRPTVLLDTLRQMLDS